MPTTTEKVTPPVVFHRLQVEECGVASIVADVRIGPWSVAVKSGFDARELARLLDTVAGV